MKRKASTDTTLSFPFFPVPAFVLHAPITPKLNVLLRLLRGWFFPLLLSFSVCFQGAFQTYVHPSFSIVPRHCAPGALWLSFLWGCTETTTADLWPFCFCIQCWMCILCSRAVLKQCGEQILQKTDIMCVRACAWVPKNLIEKMYINMSSTRTLAKDTEKRKVNKEERNEERKTASTVVRPRDQHFKRENKNKNWPSQ